MRKVTPDPPDFDDLAARVNATPRKPSRTFMIAPGLDTETLLAHACESLASANVMASDFAACWKARSAARCWGLRRSSCWVSWR